MLLSLLILFLTSFSTYTTCVAQNSDTYYIYLTDGQVLGYPKEHVREIIKNRSKTTLTLKNGESVTWPTAQISSVNEEAPDYPQFTAFKLDDKLNDQLFRDIDASISENKVSATISGIGKYLTPLFSMDIPEAVAYANGEEQISGQSRLRFANEVVYTLSLPGYQRLSVEKISDEIWSEPESNIQELSLTADMLSTNAPSGRDEGLDKMIDGDPTTYFHSTWSNDPIYPKLPQDVCPYIDVNLSRSINSLIFYYRTRPDAANRNPVSIKIYASNDCDSWKEVAFFNELPTGMGVEYESSTIETEESYRYWRFEQTACEYRSNYFVLSEFRIFTVTGIIKEPELLKPAEYVYKMAPMGREVPVHIDWFTDYAESVPRIDIDIDGGKTVTSKDYYLDALITFQGKGVWDDCNFKESVKIKGRGNTSWGYSKKPYRLKFAESVKPFGMKKGKNWNLIAQAQNGSLMTNPVGHKIARMVGMKTANDVIPVELYMNGEYCGSYLFTQKVGMANNSVDFEDESMAVLFELDSYYDEVYRFRSDSYSLPVNIKTPNFDEDNTELNYDSIKNEFNRFETAVYDNSNYERLVDMDMLVRYMLVNDLVLNAELRHPKSTFLSRENLGHMASQYTFGPAWDFDWAFGYEGTSSYCRKNATSDLFSTTSTSSGNRFYSQILRSSKWVQYRYFQLWEEFMDKHLNELIDFVDDYYAYARSSFEHNASKWGDGYNYGDNITNMKSWLEQRAHYIMNNLTPYASDAKEPFSYGDLNNDGYVDITDMEYMLSSLFGTSKDDFMSSQADADANNEISLNDLTWINLLIEDEQATQARSRQSNTILWENDEEEVEGFNDFDIDDMPILAPSHSNSAKSAPKQSGSISEELKLSVVYSSNKWEVLTAFSNPVPYIAYSMDFILPDAFTLSDGDVDITLSPRTEGSFTMTGRWIDNRTYRVIGYSRNSTAILDTEGTIFALSLSGTPTLSAGTYSVSTENCRVVMENAAEKSLNDASTEFDVNESQMAYTNTPLLQQKPCWPADIYDIHGRLIRTQATSLDGLKKGVYIINNHKAIKQ